MLFDEFGAGKDVKVLIFLDEPHWGSTHDLAVISGAPCDFARTTRCYNSILQGFCNAATANDILCVCNQNFLIATGQAESFSFDRVLEFLQHIGPRILGHLHQCLPVLEREIENGFSASKSNQLLPFLITIALLELLDIFVYFGFVLLQNLL